jgi:hypothetical protein
VRDASGRVSCPDLIQFGPFPPLSPASARVTSNLFSWVRSERGSHAARPNHWLAPGQAMDTQDAPEHREGEKIAGLDVLSLDLWNGGPVQGPGGPVACSDLHLAAETCYQGRTPPQASSYHRMVLGVAG